MGSLGSELDGVQLVLEGLVNPRWGSVANLILLCASVKSDEGHGGTNDHEGKTGCTILFHGDSLG